MIDNDSASDELDLRALLRPLRRLWWLVLVITVVVTAAAYYVDSHKAKVYEATTSVFVDLSDDAANQFSTGSAQVTFPSQFAVADLAKLAQSTAVGVKLKQALHSPASPEALLSQVTATPDATADFVNIVATGSTPSGAADLANAYASAFVAVGQQQVADQLAQLRQAAVDQLAATTGTGPTVAAARLQLQSRIGELTTAETNLKGPEQQLNPAAAPSTPTSPRPKRVALYAFLLALINATILVYLLERLDRRIKQVDDLAAAYGLPLLGVVPHVRDPALVTQAGAGLDAELVEAMRFLRVNLSLQALDRPIKILLVTSAVSGEGKSTVVRNLALVYREAGVDVVAVDADLRRPSLSRGLGWVGESAGLTSVLLGDAELSDGLVRADVYLPGLTRDHALEDSSIGLLPSGVQAVNPPAILGSSRMAEVLHELASNHDLVIVDSPPLLAVSDTLPLLSIVDSVILVGRVGYTTRDAARRVRAVLASTPTARLFGIVAEDAEASTDYGYNYSTSPYSKTGPPPPPAPPPAATAVSAGRSSQAGASSDAGPSTGRSVPPLAPRRLRRSK
jgi:capsular exopolysaccharide synthesis family protein